MSVSPLISLGKTIAQPTSLADNEREVLPRELCRFLSRANGLFAFESALMIRPLVHENNVHSVFEWNDHSLWKSCYGDDRTLNTLFFAEDAFGCQFGFFEDHVCFFDPETGEFDPLCKSFDEWCELIISNYNQYTGYELMHQWQSKNGPIMPGFRLCPKLPFVLGGRYEVDNLYSIRELDGILFRADIAIQLRGVPDGAKVKIVIK